MDKKDLSYGTYNLYAKNGRRIRKASLIRNSHLGLIVRFIELIPKRMAFDQALKIWARKEGINENQS